jgi:hypothetical protein
MAKPLGLPVGSVRALLLMGLVARALVDLQQGRGLAPWIGAAALVSMVAYFAARSASHDVPRTPVPDAPRTRPPLWLPRRTVRTLVLLASAYGAWLWLRGGDVSGDRAAVATVLGAFVAGVVVRWLLSRAPRPPDRSTLAFEHAQALVALLCAGGLVAIGLGEGTTPGWVEPALAAVVTYYAGAR